MACSLQGATSPLTSRGACAACSALGTDCTDCGVSWEYCFGALGIALLGSMVTELVMACVAAMLGAVRAAKADASRGARADELMTDAAAHYMRARVDLSLALMRWRSAAQGLLLVRLAPSPHLQPSPTRRHGRLASRCHGCLVICVT